MTVYVDPLKYWGTKKQWCHMATDGDISELHAFASRVGLKRSWFQNHRAVPHYDMQWRFRARAVDLGAVEVSSNDLFRKCRRKTKAPQEQI